jgi:uncharacterized membrane protein
MDPVSRAKEKMLTFWFFSAVVLGFLWIGLPWLAPVFMKLGWVGPAKVIYTLYSFQCHQMPQRSFFVFGPQTMYSLDQIQAAGGDVNNLLALRRFIGTAEMGFKVAWSDRMVSAFGSIPVMAVIWWPFRKRIRPLPLWGFILLALPMGLDAGAHFISDFAGIGMGFRYSNEWLAALTGSILPTSFYIGNALGSFNSWMRLITGSMFGLGVAWLTFPYLWHMGIESTKSTS